MVSKSLLSQDKLSFIYVGDPMCSWCYGFSTEIDKVVDALPENCEFKLVMGGLRPYNTETMADLGEFLEDHWKHVSAASDVEFNYAILKDNSFVYDTEPPARAVITVRNIDPEKELAFFKAVQKVFYVDNKNTNIESTYYRLLDALEIDKEQFITLFNSKEIKIATKEDYQLSASLGVSGFPSTVVKIDGKVYLTSNGFMKSEALLKNVHAILEKHQK